MEDLENVHRVALITFSICVVFGFVAHKTNFCTMGAISDALNMGSRGRLGAWMLAIGTAILGTQALDVAGLVPVSESRYLSPTFNWLSLLCGGLMFGIGMTLGAGCGQRNVVRLGGGNLKALVVLMVLGITAYATVRGLLGLVRINVFEAPGVDLAASGLGDQGLATALGALFRIEDASWLRLVVACVVGLAFVAWALAQSELRGSVDNLGAGIVVGLAVVGGWAVTGWLGADDFDPVTVESLSFVAPTGETISYLMTFTGSTIDFGIAAFLGTVVGSFAYAVLSGNFRVETFSSRADMVSHLVGGALMGFGGVLALGCTIGQGVSGMSTLSIGSFLALASIAFGSAITMKVQYHLLDEQGFGYALATGLRELLMPWRADPEA